MLGGYDPSHFTGQLHRVDITTKTYWTVDMAGATLGEESLFPGPVTAIVDSGCSLITAPKPVHAKLAQALGSTEVSNGQYSVDCESLPNLPDLASSTCIVGVLGLDRPGPDRAGVDSWRRLHEARVHCL